MHKHADSQPPTGVLSGSCHPEKASNGRAHVSTCPALQPAHCPNKSLKGSSCCQAKDQQQDTAFNTQYPLCGCITALLLPTTCCLTCKLAAQPLPVPDTQTTQQFGSRKGVCVPQTVKHLAGRHGAALIKTLKWTPGLKPDTTCACAVLGRHSPYKPTQMTLRTAAALSSTAK